MTTITITIPDEITQRVVSALSYRWKYPPVLDDGSPNPESRAQFIRRKVIEYMKKSVKEAEIEIAANEAATQASQSEVDIH